MSHMLELFLEWMNFSPWMEILSPSAAMLLLMSLSVKAAFRALMTSLIGLSFFGVKLKCVVHVQVIRQLCGLGGYPDIGPLDPC